MNHDFWIYLCFGIILLIGLILDISFLSKKNKVISFKMALLESSIWVLIGLGFGLFILNERGYSIALDYWTAYLTEWSLSVDNLFVFILLFQSFKVKEKYEGRALFWGILLAIILRIILITLGIELVKNYSWVLYIFGLFLLYTGIKIVVTKNKEAEVDFKKTKIAKFFYKFLKVHPRYEGNHFIIKNRKHEYFTTSLFIVVLILMFIDIAFAVDSIPATLAITQIPIAVYLSNVFAVLGLRPLYFVLKHAIHQFTYLNFGVGIILIFIGIKICLPFFNILIGSIFSFIFILSCLFLSILLSVLFKKNK
ncbi:MAG: TerC/Alx family metal homeostasis membrane protein [Chitinophagaceae bacterium]